MPAFLRRYVRLPSGRQRGLVQPAVRQVDGRVVLLQNAIAQCVRLAARPRYVNSPALLRGLLLPVWHALVDRPDALLQPAQLPMFVIDARPGYALPWQYGYAHRLRVWPVP